MDKKITFILIKSSMLSNNKYITGITYNYLHLPSIITFTGNGSAVSPSGIITYTYDAAGNKLKKVTVDNTVTPSKTTTTLYLGGAVYQNDTLQFMMHEEGRIRPTRDASNNITGFIYDYFLKDHLGNIRMVLTEQKDTSFYPPASMETAQATTEEALYANLPSTRTAISTISGYPTDNYTTPNAYVAKTNGSGNKIGPSIILKVMAGDQFNIRVSSWYKKNGSNPGSPNSIATDLVTSLINSLTGTGGPVHGTITSTDLTNSSVMPTSVNSFLNSQPSPGSTKPKAYINWVLLDEQFKFVQSSSGAEQVDGDQVFKVHTKTNLPITKNGYLYVFVSNETPNIDVYFDNLQVTHIRGPILEETHYYPFGLTMAGISSKALQFGGAENRLKYNGKELQSKEFADNSGLELYDFGARMQDPQLGRWWTVDPLSEKYDGYSPYGYGNSSPILFGDIDGREIWIYYGDDQRVQYKNRKLYDENGNKFKGQDAFINRVFQTLNKISEASNGSAILKQLVSSKNEFKFTNTAVIDANGTELNAYSFTENKNGGGEYHVAGLMNTQRGSNEGQDIASISHELFHGFQYEMGQGGASVLNELQAQLFGNNLALSLGYGTDAFGNGSPAGQVYDMAMNQLSMQTQWNAKSGTYIWKAVSTFKIGSQQNSTHLYDNIPFYKKNQINSFLIKKFFPLFRPEGGAIITIPKKNK